MDAKEAEAICGLVGTDGLERILAISRLLDSDNYYRQHPYILACHLLDLGIKTAEKNLREVVFDTESPCSRPLYQGSSALQYNQIPMRSAPFAIAALLMGL